MRQRADGNETGAGGGERRHDRSSVTPPEISVCARPRVRATASRISSSVRLSSRILSAPACKRLVDLREALRLDLDRQPGAMLPGPIDRRLDASGEPDVIVLDQDRVEQSGAMVGGAAGAHRVFLDHAKRRRRFSRVEHDDPPAGRVDESARACRDAREPLEKIERGALGGQQRRGRARHFRDFFACPAPLAVAALRAEKGVGSLRTTVRFGVFAACRKASNATSSPAMTQSAFTRNTPRARCDGDTVAAVVTSPVPNVLVKGAADDVAVQPGIERLDHDAAGSGSRRAPAAPVVALHGDLARFARRQLERLDAQGGAQVGLDRRASGRAAHARP